MVVSLVQEGALAHAVHRLQILAPLCFGARMPGDLERYQPWCALYLTPGALNASSSAHASSPHKDQAGSSTSGATALDKLGQLPVGPMPMLCNFCVAYTEHACHVHG